MDLHSLLLRSWNGILRTVSSPNEEKFILGNPSILQIGLATLGFFCTLHRPQPVKVPHLHLSVLPTDRVFSLPSEWRRPRTDSYTARTLNPELAARTRLLALGEDLQQIFYPIRQKNRPSTRAQSPSRRCAPSSPQGAPKPGPSFLVGTLCRRVPCVETSSPRS